MNTTDALDPLRTFATLIQFWGGPKEMELKQLHIVVFVYKCDLGCHHLVAQEQC
jgi:hypothetical protein